MNKHDRPPGRRSIAIICLSVLCAGLIGCIMFQTKYVQDQLKEFGLLDSTHENSQTIASWNTYLEKQNIDADIVFFGDSLTRRYDFQSAFPGKTVVNLGFSGDSILDMTKRVYMLETVRPEKVFLMAGINSLKNEKMIHKYYRQYVELCGMVRAAVPSARLYIQSVLPISPSYDHRFLGGIRGVNNRFIVRFNTMIHQYADDHGLTYIDLYPVYEKNGALNPDYAEDDFHITKDAYHFWTEAIEEYVNE